MKKKAETHTYFTETLYPEFIKSLQSIRSKTKQITINKIPNQAEN